MRPGGLVGSVERAIAVLDAVAAAGVGVTAKAVARRTGLPLPTVYRLLGTWRHHGYLTRIPGGGYRLGPRAAALAEHAAAHQG